MQFDNFENFKILKEFNIVRIAYKQLFLDSKTPKLVLKLFAVHYPTLMSTHYKLFISNVHLKHPIVCVCMCGSIWIFQNVIRNAFLLLF